MNDSASSASVMESTPLPGIVSKLRVVGIIEGISTLLLFAVAMPLKYVWGMDMAVTIVGGAHGGLFVLYALWALLVKLRYEWPITLVLIMFIGAVIPFGPFVVDRKIPQWYRDHRKADS